MLQIADNVVTFLRLLSSEYTLFLCQVSLGIEHPPLLLQASPQADVVCDITNPTSCDCSVQVNNTTVLLG